MCEPLVDRKCACCGKIFCPAPYHVFKVGAKYYCSWSCYYKSVYGKNGKKLTRGRRINQYDRNGNYIATYPSIQKASSETGVSYETIRVICNGQTKTPHRYIFKYADKDDLQKGVKNERTDETDTE